MQIALFPYRSIFARRKTPKTETEAIIKTGSCGQPSLSAGLAALPMVQVPAPRGNNEEAVSTELRCQTGMNSSYSRYRLKEFNWQFETALNTIQASESILQMAFALE